MSLKVGSLFSGYGGLDLAVTEVLDAEVVWHCEWDDAPSKILEAHWPDVPNYRDVSKVDWSQVEPVDVLTGGFPCQDVSLAGARRGLAEGTRSGLWSEFAKAIGVLRPGLVVIENVRGLLSASAASDVEQCAWCLGDEPGEPHLRALGAVLGDLADLGYDARWTGVRAADAGAPHSRFRVFIVAYPGGEHVAHAYKGGYSNVRETVVNELLPTVVTTDSSGTRNATANRSIDSKHHAGNTLTDVLLPIVTTQDGKNTGGQSQFDRNTKPLNTQVLVGTEWGKFEPAIRRWEQVTGREAPLPTKPDGKDGNHRLSSAFTEWMMGLPKGWITDVGLKRNDELKACGNGVVPQQAVLALRQLLTGVTAQPAGGGQVNLPTPTVSDTFTGNLASTQQKPGSMHSVTLPQAVTMMGGN